VPAIYRDTRSWQRTKNLPQRVDLADIESVDSACVALLLEWASWAKAEGQPMYFANPPGALCALVRLFDIEKVLSLENSCQH
jgi:ABC-type transporter Mla MlaB component